jgi:hypothetical protein
MFMAITIEHIEDWRGTEVRDSAGESLGKAQEIWFDSGTGTPLLVSIKSGLLGRRTKMIPIDGASVGPDYLRVTQSKSAIDDAPDGNGDEAPNAVELDEIGKAYGLRFSEKVSLESATAVEQRRADAEEARLRAEELEAQAREKAAALDSAQSRSKDAGADAEQAQREAQEAQEAARQARLQAEQHAK